MRLADLHVLEAGREQLALELLASEGTGDAARPLRHVAACRLIHVRVGQDVADRKSSAGPKHATRFAKDGRLVARQIDDAVGDEHVDRVELRRVGEDLAILDAIDAWTERRVSARIRDLGPTPAARAGRSATTGPSLLHRSGGASVTLAHHFADLLYFSHALNSSSASACT